MKTLVLLALGLAAVAAVPTNPQRIVGGSVTTIGQYPFGAALLFSWTGANHRQSCGGAIINNRSILSAAHCFLGDPVNRWRIRVGSTTANSGGSVSNTNAIIIHPSYNRATLDNDIAILRSASNFVFGANVRAGSIAGSNYNLADNQAVWAIGWGATAWQGASSEQLRHVQIWTVNQAVCRTRYAELRRTITDNMLCSGWLDVGGRDQCQGDSGGPLLHNNVIVGVCSWGERCALARYPGVNARVSRYTSWIQSNSSNTQVNVQTESWKTATGPVDVNGFVDPNLKMKTLVLLALGLAAVTAVPTNPQRIVGGSVTTIGQYPFGAALLFSWTGANHRQSCGGAIINNRSILSAAHCFLGDPVNRWQIRVGSTNANSGGSVSNTNAIIIHPSYNRATLDNDIAILRSASNFVFGANVRAGSIAGSNYNLADNQAVWAIGWGAIAVSNYDWQGVSSEQLRHVQIWTVNQAVCRTRYAELGRTITDNMLCSGWLDVGGRDQCQGDSGGPLLHNNVIVGVCSWGERCALARYPGVNARVSRYTSWIQSNSFGPNVKMKTLLLIALGLAAVTAVPTNPQRIVGGSVTTIGQYPFGAALLFSWTGANHRQSCGGSIINNRSILSAAHCFVGDTIVRWRIRVGSTNANSGGTIFNTNAIILHPNYNRVTLDNDVAILRAASNFVFGANVRAGSIAGSNYNLADNQAVWAIGWGATAVSHYDWQGASSEQLRHVQIWTVNQAVCRNRYAELRRTITDNMLCSGWLDVGGRDQCQGDSGGPLLHNNVIVGVCSWGERCALARYPGVNARVSRYTSWIQSNS
ncbi:ovochymase-like [Epargyreus clarus]|uniref:ovochymase-like n=1 Tax=Epargyreus clarus TaxID=520877 RepID=UPI003C2D27CB